MAAIARTDDQLREFIVMNSVRLPSGCWEWMGTLDDGYGHLSYHGTKMRVHQVSYILFVGPLTKGLTIDHLCYNRACANPAHLEEVTRGENVLRGNTASGLNSRKTHCKNGHLFDIVRKNGARGCRICYRQSKRDWEERRKRDAVSRA